MSRRAVVLSVIGGVVVLALAGAALAAILLRAEVTGSTTAGTASLQWVKGTTGTTGAVPGLFAEYTGADITNGATIPAGVTCTATVNADGSLSVNVAGLLPGEGCVFGGLNLKNASSLGVTGLVLDYGTTQYGDRASGATKKVHAWLGQFVTSKYVPYVMPTTLAAGALAYPTGSSLPALIIELPTTTAADAAAYPFAGIAVTANTNR